MEVMKMMILSGALLLLSLYRADGDAEVMVDQCVFNSTDLKDIDYTRTEYFNKLKMYMFSSSLGKFVGFTENGVKQAEYFNNNTAYLNGLKAQKVTYCQHNIGIWYSNALSKSVKPYARLHSETPPAGGHPAMLVCSVYDFYPKMIQVSWRRNGEVVSSDVTSTDEMADGNWYYQIHSHLEYTPKSGEEISCVVEHASLKEPLITKWDPSMPDSERNKIAIGASGLSLGVILSLAGFIYFKSKSRGRILVPSS